MQKFLFLLLFIGSATLAKSPKPSTVHVISIHSGICYFKVTDALIGGAISIYDLQGGLVFSDTIFSRKVIIDFYDLETGQYTVKIKNNGISEQFEFTSDLPTKFMDAGFVGAKITMVQYHKTKKGKHAVVTTSPTPLDNHSSSLAPLPAKETILNAYRAGL